MAGRDIGRPGVDEFAVNLVGKEEQVVFLDQIADAVHFAARVEVTRGVVGVANQNAARAGIDELLEFGDVRQGEPLLDGRNDGPDGGACRDGECHVIGVGGFGDDNFVAGVEARHESEEHRFGAACGNDDVVGRELDLILLVIAGQFLAQRTVTVAGAVFENRTVDFLQGIEPHLRRGQVGLADVEMVDFDASGAGRFGQRNEFAYRRCRHQLGAL